VGVWTARPRFGARESLIVAAALRLAPFGPGIQVLELDVEDGCLQLIQAEIPADE